MEKILVMTDSNSGITQKEKEKYGIEIVPMPFMINDQEYFEDISLSQEDFYKHLEDNTKINTSQPSLGCLEEMWTNHLKNYDYILEYYLLDNDDISINQTIIKSLNFDVQDLPNSQNDLKKAAQELMKNRNNYLNTRTKKLTL